MRRVKPGAVGVRGEKAVPQCAGPQRAEGDIPTPALPFRLRTGQRAKGRKMRTAGGEATQKIQALPSSRTPKVIRDLPPLHTWIPVPQWQIPDKIPPSYARGNFSGMTRCVGFRKAAQRAPQAVPPTEAPSAPGDFQLAAGFAALDRGGQNSEGIRGVPKAGRSPQPAARLPDSAPTASRR